MLKLNEKELRAISKLLSNEDFKVFLDILAKRAEENNRALVMKSLDSGQMFTLQGQTRESVGLIEAITTAPAKLKELTNPKESR